MLGYFDLEDLKYSFQISLSSASPEKIFELIHQSGTEAFFVRK
jgi:hypothetical protein